MLNQLNINFFSKVNVEYLYFVTWVFSEQLNQGLQGLQWEYVQSKPHQNFCDCQLFGSYSQGTTLISFNRSQKSDIRQVKMVCGTAQKFKKYFQHVHVRDYFILWNRQKTWYFVAQYVATWQSNNKYLIFTLNSYQCPPSYATLVRHLSGVFICTGTIYKHSLFITYYTLCTCIYIIQSNVILVIESQRQFFLLPIYIQSNLVIPNSDRFVFWDNSKFVHSNCQLKLP